MRRLIALATVAVIAAVVLVIAATTGGGAQQPAPAAASGAYSSDAHTQRTAAGTVALAKSNLGSILVDARGRTLYLFEADKPGVSDCSGSCASIWPPLTAIATPRAGTGVTAGKLATIARPGGERQVTYNGHPLYTYAGDTKAGATTGQALDQFGAEWYVVNAAGAKIDED
jgi:predicted lipoprotein with Yx(FWY)xxD motif